MLILRDEYWKPVAARMQQDFWELFFQPIVDITKNQPELFNSRQALVEAIRSGRVSYADGVWTGDFNMTITAELSKFARFVRRSKIWRGFPPPDILAATVVAADRAQKIGAALRSGITELKATVEETIKRLTFPIDTAIVQMNGVLFRDLEDISILPKLTEDMRRKLARDYNFNQQLNIKNWAPEQIERLRSMVDHFAIRGYRRNELEAMIMQEWGVTANKARFLGRQETGLFMSKLRRERHLDAGVRRYRWSTSQDERVRPTERGETNNHRRLHGKVFTFGEPPIVDPKNGRRAEPGEDYGCRCVAIGQL